MRNFVPALEESLMKVMPEEITRPMPETKYKANGGWFSVQEFGSKSPVKKETKRRFVKGARA